MRELLLEIWTSVRRNRLRTFLTGFSVAWGIFMLIILLGSGNGLQNGVLSNFGDRAVNSVSLYGGYTSMPYGGYQSGRNIQLKTEDLQMLRRDFPEVRQVAARGWYSFAPKVSYGTEYTGASLIGATPELPGIDGIKILEGRFINQLDVDEFRKVVVVDENAVRILFKGESCIGKRVNVSGIDYTVVGLYKRRSYGNSSSFYIPISTGQLIYAQNRKTVGQTAFTVDGIETDAQSEALEKRVREKLAAAHSFDPNDRNAVWIWNQMRSYKEAMLIFRGIALFVWIIGIGTLTAGIVGVSNIMLVTVRERTSEFGIRKALGAKPASIVRLILTETVIITAFFGYIGMVLGVAVMEAVNYFLERASAAKGEDSFNIFLNPTLNLSVAVSATVVLIVAGLIAGYVPARRAARIKTIDALRFNK